MFLQVTKILLPYKTVLFKYPTHIKKEKEKQRKTTSCLN